MTGEGVTTTSAQSAVNEPQPPSEKFKTTVYQVVPIASAEDTLVLFHLRAE